MQLSLLCYTLVVNITVVLYFNLSISVRLCFVQSLDCPQGNAELPLQNLHLDVVIFDLHARSAYYLMS